MVQSGARLIGLLNEDLGEALYRRITQQGIAPTEKTCLTVPALKDAMRKSGLVGQAILNKKEYAPGPLCGTKDSETLNRARMVLNKYFQLLERSNPTLWEAGRKGYLCTNRSLDAYLQLLSEIISYMETSKGLSARELEPDDLIIEIEEYLDPILKWLAKVSQVQMEKRFDVQYGSGGPSRVLLSALPDNPRSVF